MAAPRGYPHRPPCGTRAPPAARTLQGRLHKRRRRPPSGAHGDGQPPRLGLRVAGTRPRSVQHPLVRTITRAGGRPGALGGQGWVRCRPTSWRRTKGAGRRPRSRGGCNAPAAVRPVPVCPGEHRGGPCTGHGAAEPITTTSAACLTTRAPASGFGPRAPPTCRLVGTSRRQVLLGGAAAALCSCCPPPPAGASGWNYTCPGPDAWEGACSAGVVAARVGAAALARPAVAAGCGGCAAG